MATTRSQSRAMATVPTSLASPNSKLWSRNFKRKSKPWKVRPPRPRSSRQPQLLLKLSSLTRPRRWALRTWSIICPNEGQTSTSKELHHSTTKHLPMVSTWPPIRLSCSLRLSLIVPLQWDCPQPRIFYIIPLFCIKIGTIGVLLRFFSSPKDL